ncbi:MAG: PQQ-like beta-propeller repeat protein [Candidatus Aenigmarchaeota archaeon]|nr:PQQ-like beta-propeller repeat protein [Candidatus Aenigmarchaeota archaeon]
MERYGERDPLVQSSFDTSQFADVAVIGALSHFEKTRQTIVFNIGMGGSIMTVTPPLVSDGRIVFGACDRHIYCIGLDGKEVWRFKMDDIIMSTPTRSGGTLYGGSYDGNLYALDWENGALRWKFHTNGRIVGTIIVMDGKVIFGSADGNAYCLDLAGRLQWRVPTSSPLAGFCAYPSERLWKDVIFFPTFDGKVFAIDTRGRIRWTFATKGSYTTSIHAEGDRLFFGCQDRSVYCLECADGRVVWKFPAKDTTYVMAATPETVFASSRDYHVYALDPATGRSKWTFATRGMVWCEAQKPQGGVLYVGGMDSHVYALQAATGALLWKFKAGGPVWHGPALAGDRLVFGSYDCNLYCLDLQGELLWRFPTSMSSPAAIDTGEAQAAATLTTIWQQDAPTGQERYQQQTIGEGGRESVYTFKSEYTTKSQYAMKKR